MIKTLLKWKKIRKGLYEYTDSKNRLWYLENVQKADDFDRTEWHVGTEDDPHADQFNSMQEADYSTFMFLQEEK